MNNPDPSNYHDAWHETAIVIVTFNSSQVLEKCLHSVAKAAQVFVVDNNSSDTTCEVALATLPSVTLCRNIKNMGFGHACNIGLNAAQTRYIVFLNPDATLSEKALQILYDTAQQHPDAKMLAPALENIAGQRVTSFDNSRLHQKSWAHETVADACCCVGFISGAVMFAPTQVMRDIGGFDDHIFLFYEDDDICERVRKIGSIIYQPAATACHLSGHSSPPNTATECFKAWHMAWSRLYVLSKHSTRRHLATEAAMRIAYGLFQIMRLSITRKSDLLRIEIAQLKGLLAYLCGYDARKFDSPTVFAPRPATKNTR